MFKSIKIKNLRTITELEIDNLGQVNLLVGQNNCGKTTILEAIFFLVGAPNPDLPLKANMLRGLRYLSSDLWTTFFHNRSLIAPIEISGKLRANSEDQRLLIRLIEKKKRETQQVSSVFVELDVEPSNGKTPFTANGLELEYTTSEKHGQKSTSKIFQKGNDVRTEGQKESQSRGFIISPSAILGDDLKDRFGAAQRNKRLPQLMSLLQKIEPDMIDLRLNEIGLLEADNIGLPGLIPVNLMGGGIAKFLSVGLAMLDYQDGVVLIDEIENGLYYSAQQKLWEAILNWAHELNVQVFATTHSQECIRAFNACAESTLFKSDAKLYRIERKDEKFRAVDYTKNMLAESIDSNWEVR